MQPKEVGFKRLKSHPLRRTSQYRVNIDKIPYEFYVSVPGDGNCFYYSFVLSLSNVLRSASSEKKWKFFEKLKLLQKKMLNFFQSECYFSDFYDDMVDFLQNISSVDSIHTISSLFSDEVTNENTTGSDKDLADRKLNTQRLSPTIAWIKICISFYIQSNEDVYNSFIITDDFKKYCRQEIEPFGKNTGDIEISVLSTVFEVLIDVFYTDQNGYVATFGDGDLKIPILYSFNHYEPLFDRIDIENKTK